MKILVQEIQLLRLLQTVWFLLWAFTLARSAVLDARERRIPDSCTGLLGLCGLAAFFLFPDTGPEERILGLFVVSVPMLLAAMAIPGAFGGGDVKLMAAAGLCLGWGKALCAAGTGIVLAAVYCVWLLLARKKGRKTQFPLGPFLCLGIFAAELAGEAIIAWFRG